MKYNSINIDGMPVAVIDSYYDDDAYNKIWQELIFLNNDNSKFKDPQLLGSSQVGSKVLKHAKGLHLDAVYQDRSVSNILKENRKLFSSEITTKLIDLHPFFNLFNNADIDGTKVHYYGNGDYYEFHSDRSVITAITWLCKTPKKFIGGDLKFNNNYIIECVNNRTVVFPSFLPHSVTLLKLDSIDTGHDGRYAITQFTGITGSG